MCVKSLLTGCAAGVVVLAAGLPVKAVEAVQYVKICSLYGAGFYYIPGTDTCLKVGGYVRAQTEWNSDNGLTVGSSNGPFGPNTIADGLSDRASNSLNFTGRGAISVDARNQTAFGALRAYIRLGEQTFGNATSNEFYFDRAFIQWGGFTAGVTQSFFDVFSNTELFSYFDAKTSGDTYNYGVQMFAYTAQFGSGISATIAAEVPRYRAGVIDGSAGSAFGVNGTTVTDTAGFNVPDIVGNARIDQSWGYVGVSGALHQVAGQYYGSSNTLMHPSDKYGWAAQVGGLLNLPWGDRVGASFAGTQGAIGYVTKAGNWQVFGGNTAGVGWVADGIFDSNNPVVGGNTPIHLTNAVSVNAGYEHFWNSQWRTSVYGGYTRVWYDSETVALINSHLPGASATLQCGVPVFGAVWPPITMAAGGVGNSCSPNFSFYQIGSRTQWNVTRDFSLGVDVVYTGLNTAYKGPIASYTASGNSAISMNDQNTVSGIFRVQYNFAAGD